MRIVIAIACILVYLFNSIALSRLYDMSDYNQFVEAYYIRCSLYEVIFCLLFYSLYAANTGILRAVFCFAFVLCAASCVDKLVFKISHYLWSDILVVVAAILLAYVVYKKEKHV